MEESASWPAGVYLETSVLRQLPTDVTSAELLQLREQCKLLDIPIVIPKTALNEWIASRREDLTQRIGSYENSLEKVKNLLAEYGIAIELPSPDSLRKSQEAIFSGIENMINSRLKEIGVVVAETPNIPLELLLKMSVDKIRPFEEKGEKGFRDSVILFTILEFAKNLPSGFHIVVTADKVFNHADVHQIASDHKVKLIVVSSAQAAINELENFISQAIKEIRAKRAEVLRGFLSSHTQEISNFIRSQQSFVGLFGFKFEGGINPEDVKAISSVELLEIHNPTPGILPKGVKEDRVKISFDAKVKFHLIITQYYFNILSQVLYGPQFEFRQESGVWERKDEYRDPRPKEVPMTIERDLKIEASALLNRDTDQYSELQLERIV